MFLLLRVLHMLPHLSKPLSKSFQERPPPPVQRQAVTQYNQVRETGSPNWQTCSTFMPSQSVMCVDLLIPLIFH